MQHRIYYVYALKDPRCSPALPFYVGKGCGPRAYEHLTTLDDSPKGQRIREILDVGQVPLVSMLAEDLTEHQALKLEAELIAAFGTQTTGGLLLNRVVPTGLGRQLDSSIVVPSGMLEKAQLGLQFLKDAIVELCHANPHGLRNADIAKALGLKSEYFASQKDWLSYSLVGILMREQRIIVHKNGKQNRYKTPSQPIQQHPQLPPTD